MAQNREINPEIQVDFYDAVRTGGWRHFINRLSRRSDDLLSYDEVRNHIPINRQHQLGSRIVPIDQIIGSVGRCRDFDRSFYPRRTVNHDRWMSIARALYHNVPLPLVELYKVGEAYFVQDGHHRISVARASGQEFIDALVVEIDEC